MSRGRRSRSAAEPFRRLLLALALLGPALLACDQPIDVVVKRLPAPDDAAPDDPMDAATADAEADAAGDDAGDLDADTGVDGDADTGAPIDPRCPYRSAPPPSGTAASVADQVAAGLGRALCTCDGYSGGALTVDALAGASGDVGIGGERDPAVAVAAPLALPMSSGIAGALTVGGSAGVSLGTGVVLNVGTDLSVGGPLEGGEASVMVVGDAQVAARIDLAELTVGGTLTQTPGEQMVVVNAPTLGDMVSAEVLVPPPCACAPASLLDVAALVAARAPAADSLPDGALPAERCAQYSVEGGTLDAISLDVPTSAALYVTGQLALDSLEIAVAEGAELDLYLQGDLLVRGALELGSDTAGVVRFHVGGGGTIELPQGGTLHGALYAPNAELVLSAAALTVTGAVFVQRVAAADAAVVVHHDAQAGGP
jgi:hypothetical protein